MDFETALAELKKGAIIHIWTRPAITMTRLHPSGHAQRPHGAGWTDSKPLSMEDILSDDWEIVREAPE